MIMSNRKRSVIHALNCVMKSIFCICHCSQLLSIRYTFPFPFDSFTPNVRIKIMNFSFPFWPQANVKSQVVCVQCHFYVLALAALHEKQESWRASAVSWEARRIANLNNHQSLLSFYEYNSCEHHHVFQFQLFSCTLLQKRKQTKEKC